MRIPLAVVGGMVPMGADVIGAISSNGWLAGLDHLSLCTTGITTKPGGAVEWHPSYALQKFYLPMLGGVVAHKLAARLGVNRMLSRAGIPFISI